MRKQNPQALEDTKAQGWSVRKESATCHLWTFFIWAGLGLPGLLPGDSSAGIRMLSLKNYGLVILASILAALPGVSCSGCCGLGLIVGIWAIVVLINPDIRASFQ